ncbi:MAG: hypothetical protein KC416_06815, partial [Myxococcales bacterium]|nr:hypothetical protein [Myxococcales bacterium]
MRFAIHFLAFVAVLFTFVGCSLDNDPRRAPDEEVVDAGEDASTDVCDDGRFKCDGDCCDSDSVCSSNTVCCARDSLCGTSCCGAGEVCEGAVCHKDC